MPNQSRKRIARMSPTLLQTQFPQPLAAIMVALRQGDLWEGELIHTPEDG
jgi:hypothetical protein